MGWSTSAYTLRVLYQCLWCGCDDDDWNFHVNKPRDKDSPKSTSQYVLPSNYISLSHPPTEAKMFEFLQENTIPYQSIILALSGGVFAFEQYLK
jgi:hypothetical protein